MTKIDGRKYEVELEDGRVVSRQYAHFLINKDVYNARRYNTVEKKKKQREYLDEWLKKFEEEKGIPYWKYRKEQRNEHKKSNNRKVDYTDIQPKDV